MTTTIDLEKIVHEIGPGFAAKIAGRDATDAFVDDNYDVLTQHRIFSAVELCRRILAWWLYA